MAVIDSHAADYGGIDGEYGEISCEYGDISGEYGKISGEYGEVGDKWCEKGWRNLTGNDSDRDADDGENCVKKKIFFVEEPCRYRLPGRR